jgi:hypothetical protein
LALGCCLGTVVVVLDTPYSLGSIFTWSTFPYQMRLSYNNLNTATVLTTLALLTPLAVTRSRMSSLSIRGGSLSTAAETSKVDEAAAQTQATSSIDVVFSDLDGTLIHYPKGPGDLSRLQNIRGMILLPPSSTGMIGVMSGRTLELCRDIRRKGVKFILVSGMRASTLLKRLPYLPKADAYCCEAGGRIFYPVTDERSNSLAISPFAFDGAESLDLEPFYLVEDMEWRREMEKSEAAGIHGYIGNEALVNDQSSEAIPLELREGILWSHARSLTARGFVTDLKGYSTCFRVNREHQTADVLPHFDSLASGQIPCPSELSTSSNLGCVDFYPSSSGKRNWYAPRSRCT